MHSDESWEREALHVRVDGIPSNRGTSYSFARIMINTNTLNYCPLHVHFNAPQRGHFKV